MLTNYIIKKNSFKTNILLWSIYKNPYHYWWQVRKYWKIPKIHLAHIGKITWWYGLPCRTDYYSKYLDIRSSGVGFKHKYDDIRFEWDPYLCFTLFRKWQLIFIWNFYPYFTKYNSHLCLESEATWEAILEMTEGTSISDACHKVGFYTTHESCKESEYFIPSRTITVFRNMTKKGIFEYYNTSRTKELKD